MKIGGPGSTGKTTAAKKSGARKAGGAGFSNMLNATPEVDAGQAAESAAPASAVASVDAILALQSVDDSLNKKSDKKAKQWGRNLLDQLDRIRNALLLGDLTKDQIDRLTQMIAKEKQNAETHELQAVLDEIELRALVESAKYDASRW